MKKLLYLITTAVLVTSFIGWASPVTAVDVSQKCADGTIAQAELGQKCSNGTVTNTNPSVPNLGGNEKATCPNGGVKLSIGFGATTCAGSDTENPLLAYLRLAIRFVSGLVGLAMTLVIIIGGIMYMTSSGSPKGVEMGKKTLAGGVVGIIVFILLYAIINYLIPGGVF